MQLGFVRSLCAALGYWRTILLVLSVGSVVAALFRDAIAVLLATLACAFVFSAYEHRRWISMPPDLLVGGITLRLTFAFASTYLLCHTQMSPALRLIARM